MNNYSFDNDSIRNDIINEIKILSKPDISSNLDNISLISGSSNINLSNKISNSLNKPLTICNINNFSNGEIKVNIEENIRNKDVCIIQSCSQDILNNKSINDCLIETLIMIDACKRSMAKTITLILPCYPYSRQDKKEESREPISAKLVANLLTISGITRLVTIDLHASQIQGFFDIPVDNIYSLNLVINYLENTIFNNLSILQRQNEYILVSPDAGATKRSLKFANVMKLNTVIMHKQRNYEKMNTVDKTIIIGDTHLLQDKVAIICDDMCDTGGTLLKVIDNLNNYHIKGVIIIVTHGIFSNNALNRLNNCESILKIITSDSINQDINLDKYSKLEVFTISELMSNTINNIFTGESLSQLFNI